MNIKNVFFQYARELVSLLFCFAYKYNNEIVLDICDENIFNASILLNIFPVLKHKSDSIRYKNERK